MLLITTPFISAYVQEIGRARRQGGYAEAIIYFNNTDIQPSLDDMHPDIRKLCLSTTCRRKIVAEHFDWTIDEEMYPFKHHCCDICEKGCECDECFSKTTSDIENSDVCKASEGTAEFNHSDAQKSVEVHTNLRKVLEGYMLKQNSDVSYGLSGEFFTQLNNAFLNDLMSMCDQINTLNMDDMRRRFAHISHEQ